MTTAAVETERLHVRFGEVALSLLSVVNLEAHIDRAKLLGVGDADEPPYWMHVWPGARALAERLSGVDLRGVRALEIGCGLGLPALVAAARGAIVLASDRRAAPLKLVAHSAALNRLAVDLVQMDWSAMALRGKFDLILGADVAYDSADESVLVTALVGQLRRGGRLLLADSVNTYRTGLRERLEAAGMSMQQGDVAEREEDAVVWVRVLEGVKP